jgi:hypothetical protein
MKISHRELEDCRRSPRTWWQARQSAGGFRSFGYGQALLNAIHRYHRTNSARAARAHLQEMIERNFTDEARIDQLQADFASYIRWHRSSGVIVADSNIRLSYSIGSFFDLGGLISRLDVTGDGYRAIILGAGRPNWQSELRMPLIQSAIALKYGRPVDDVSVGVQEPDGGALQEQSYTSSEIATARREFERLGKGVQRLASPTA